LPSQLLLLREKITAGINHLDHTSARKTDRRATRIKRPSGTIQHRMNGAKSWLEISERHLRHNYRALVRAATAAGRSTSVLAVVKARAYGHGAGLCAHVLASAEAAWLGVSDADEGGVVRCSLNTADTARNSPQTQPRILVMSGLLPNDAEKIVANRLTPVVWSPDQVDWLARTAPAAVPFPIHLEIDTGMSRQGALPGAALDRFLDRLSTAPALHLEGVLTHFASAEISGSPLTNLQQERFEAALAQIAERGLRLDWIHAGNSSTIDEGHSLPWLQQIADRHHARSLVRSGIALYGYSLPLDGARSTLKPDLEPVLTWKSRILAVTDLPAGASIGYNATFTTSRPMRLALLPVGYSDGLRRELSGTDMHPGGWVMLHGQRAPIVGRISMNLTTVDVSAVPTAAVGDEVVLLGQGITAEDHARCAHTIPYEILCGLKAKSQLVP